MKNRKHLLLLAVITLLVAACTSKENTTASANDSLSQSADSLASDIRGDFDGDGKIETGHVRLLAEGAIETTPWTYSLEFSNPQLTAIEFTTTAESGFSLINEGDLNGEPGDELSLFTRTGQMGRAYLQPYTWSNQHWRYLIEGFPSTAMQDTLKLQDLLFREGDEVYYYQFVETDPDSDEDSGFRKEKADLTATMIEPVTLGVLKENDPDLFDCDFDGDEITETAKIRLVKEGVDEEPSEYVVEFSRQVVGQIYFSDYRGGAFLINEGDLDGVPGQELTIHTGLYMSGQSQLTTYSFRDGNWVVIAGFQIPDILPDDMELADIIFKENGQVYYYTDESLRAYKDTNDKSTLVKEKLDMEK